MNVIKFEDDTEQIIPLVKDVIVRGGVMIGPTDTVYGIFGRADEEEVIKRMLDLKKSPEEKAFPIFVKDIKMARWYACISDAKARLLQILWPGPITAIFYHKEKLPPMLTGNSDSIGIRMPDHPLLIGLLAELMVPMAQTSANISEEPPARNAEEVFAYVESKQDKLDLFIDGGEVSGESSVVIDLRTSTPQILRTGLMSKDELDRLMQKMLEVLHA